MKTLEGLIADLENVLYNIGLHKNTRFSKEDHNFFADICDRVDNWVAKRNEVNELSNFSDAADYLLEHTSLEMSDLIKHLKALPE